MSKETKALIGTVLVYIGAVYIVTETGLSETVKGLIVSVLILVSGLYFGIAVKVGKYHRDVRGFGFFLRIYAKVGGWITALVGLLGVLHWVGVMVKGK